MLSVFYQPFGNYNGIDSIGYKIYDDQLAVSNTANIAININPCLLYTSDAADE